MTATNTAPQKLTPYERKLARLQDARGTARAELDDVIAKRSAAVVDSEHARTTAATALQHAQEDAEASKEATLLLVAKRDRLLAELEQVRADLATADVRRLTVVATLGEAQRHLTACEAAVTVAGAPFDRHIAALTEDVKRYDYRIEQHIGRGPGSMALFVGVKG